LPRWRYPPRGFCFAAIGGFSFTNFCDEIGAPHGHSEGPCIVRNLCRPAIHRRENRAAFSKAAINAHIIVSRAARSAKKGVGAMVTDTARFVVLLLVMIGAAYLLIEKLGLLH
jgi:hypothetical protein